MQNSFDIIKETILRQVSSGILPAYVARLNLSPETRLLDLGIDSLGKMTLIAELGDYFSKEFPELGPDESVTLGEIAAQMRREPRQIEHSRRRI